MVAVEIISRAGVTIAFLPSCMQKALPPSLGTLASGSLAVFGNGIDGLRSNVQPCAQVHFSTSRRGALHTSPDTPH